MPLPDDTLCLFSARIENEAGSIMAEVPEQEATLGEINPGEVYRVAVLPATGKQTTKGSERERSRQAQGTPVSRDETVPVEIEDIGEQGDGIARIGPGYIVFVPDTDIGDRVTVEIREVRENFAFGEVVEPAD